MKAIISFLTSALLLWAVGWGIYHFLNPQQAYAALFVITLLWLLGQKKHTDKKLNDIELHILTLTSILTKGRISGE